MFPCLPPPPCYSALLLGFISGEKGDSRGLPILLCGKAKPQGWNSQILGCKKTFAWRIYKGENWINSFREIKEREFFFFISASVRAPTQSRTPKIFGLCCSAHAAPHIISRKENAEVKFISPYCVEINVVLTHNFFFSKKPNSNNTGGRKKTDVFGTKLLHSLHLPEYNEMMHRPNPGSEQKKIF